MSGAISQQVLKAICSAKIKILDHPIFELQKDGSYINDLNARIVQNAEDQAWFIIGLEDKGRDQKRIKIKQKLTMTNSWSHWKGFIVSFDGFECPNMNTKWYQLNTKAMNYSEYDVTMNAFDN